MGPVGPEWQLTGRRVCPSEVFGARQAFHCRERQVRMSVCVHTSFCGSMDMVQLTVPKVKCDLKILTEGISVHLKTWFQGPG